jgi:prenyltransferase beta subunit
VRAFPASSGTHFFLAPSGRDRYNVEIPHPTRSQTMSRAILFLLFACLPLVAVRSQTPDEKKTTVAYVLQRQQADGSFVATDVKSAKPGLKTTSTSLRALKYFGGEPKEPTNVAKFVASHFDKATGGFADQPAGKVDVFTTAVGLMAVTQLKMPSEPYLEPAMKFMTENAKSFEDIRIAAAGFEAVGKKAPKADDWIKEIVKMRNADGIYGKGSGTARATGSAAAAILRLGGTIDMRDNVVKAMKAGQRADGGFGKEEEQASDLETSYRVMRALMMMKEKPDEAKLRTFIAKCRNADGGYGVAPGQASSVNGVYFAGIILHWLDQK